MNIAIIQARMGSTRLPGKVLRLVNGIPMLEFMYERVAKSNCLDEIVIATTNDASDDLIEDLCVGNG